MSTVLCYTHPETALHMLAECPDAIAVWLGLQEWLGFSFQDPPSSPCHTFKTWWHNMLNLQAPGAKDRTQKTIYTMWNLWKERCHRMFDKRGLIAAHL
jgi:hypothetical protein